MNILKNSKIQFKKLKEVLDCLMAYTRATFICWGLYRNTYGWLSTKPKGIDSNSIYFKMRRYRYGSINNVGVINKIVML